MQRKSALWSLVSLVTLLVFGFAGSVSAQSEAPTVEWIRQFGTSGNDTAYNIAIDATGVYVGGSTESTLPGQTNAGDSDAFVRKYDLQGTELWTRQFGSSGNDGGVRIAVDATGVYVAGSVGSGALPGQTSSGLQDVYLRKYALDGTELWTHQFGSSGIDSILGVAVDATGVYMAGSVGSALPGQTNAGGVDAFIRKYDLDGTELWTRQFGSSRLDIARDVALDATGVYVVGRVDGSLPGQTSTGPYDAFIRKYDLDGTELWTRQFSRDGRAIYIPLMKLNASGLYLAWSVLDITQSTNNTNTVLCKYDFDGTELWTRQISSNSNDGVYGMAVDAAGVYLNWGTFDPLTGNSSVFTNKCDLDGTELWTRQFGSSGNDSAYGITVDATGVYVAGSVGSELPGQISAGGSDAFVVKFAPPGNTPAGTDVAVDLNGGTSTAGGATLTFADVTAPGNTTMTESTVRPQPPTGFRLGNPQTYVELATTATYTGNITVCLNYANISFKKESTLKLFHYVNGAWTDSTVSLNTATKVICGTVSSLSPFIVAEPENIPPTATITPIGLTILGQATQFIGSSSVDPDGTIVSYVWTFGDGTGTTGVDAGHAYSASGTYTATLTVTDDELDLGFFPAKP